MRALSAAPRSVTKFFGALVTARRASAGAFADELLHHKLLLPQLWTALVLVACIWGQRHLLLVVLPWGLLHNEI